MLKRADENDRAAMERFCKNSLLGAYLMCRLQCYGFGYDFVKFWCAETDGELTALIGALDNTAILLASAKADHAELAAFLQMMPFSSVMTTDEIARLCGFQQFTTKKALKFCGGEPVPAAEEASDLKAVYDLISREIPGSFSREKEAYLAFLSDFTFRKNRNAARSAALYENGVLCACALTAAETETVAVLSGIATDPDVRGKGFGKRVVLLLANTLQAEGKAVYVIALNDEAVAFYRHIGFEDDQKLAIIERNSHV